MVKKFFNNKITKILSLLTLLLVPLILIILPADYFDNGQTICASVLLFDIECYGCGMTRAVMHFIHFEFTKALEYNKLVILVFPLLTLLWLKMVFYLFDKKIFKWF
tara:strand:- start:309 stop:626 length:318 start_codon:yes stop_codon:yes gene_type:complete